MTDRLETKDDQRFHQASAMIEIPRDLMEYILPRDCGVPIFVNRANKMLQDRNLPIILAQDYSWPTSTCSRAVYDKKQRQNRKRLAKTTKHPDKLKGIFALADLYTKRLETVGQAQNPKNSYYEGQVDLLVYCNAPRFFVGTGTLW